MPKVLFRADAERSIGVGDLMSLVYLSEEFRKNAWEAFFLVKDYPAALELLKARDIKNVHLLSHNLSMGEEVRAIKRLCKDKIIDCLFMQITKNSLLDYKGLGRPAPVKACVNFDGVITADFDIVINWCVDASDRIYEKYAGGRTKFILGFENTILPGYCSCASIAQRAYPNGIKRILVSMGGVDEFNATQKIVEALSCHGAPYEVRIITGPGYEFQNKLGKFIATQNKGYSLKHNAITLWDDYLWADAAFSAGGLTSSELVAAKTPAIFFSTYKHQVARCEYYSRKEWAVYAGSYTECSRDKILDSLHYLADNIASIRSGLLHSNFGGANAKIYEDISSCRQSG